MISKNLSVGENGHLFFASADTVELAKKYGTPAYIMDENGIREKCRLYKNVMNECFSEAALPLYAGKALCFKKLYEIIRDEGMGIDLVSSGEIYTAYEAGFPMEKSFFHGNAKTDADISFAMEKGVGYFVCDNGDELNSIENEAAKRGITQKILIRVTPGINPHTNAKISTGNEDSKFGVSISDGSAEELCRTALELPHIELKGFHCHIGSQIFETAPFVGAAEIMTAFVKTVKDSLGYEAEMLDLGGGIGVRYVEQDPVPDIKKIISEIAATVKSECKRLGIKIPFICMEPGRSIVAESGITLYTVSSTKEITGIRNYVSTDGGMTDNPRYTLYCADYTVLNASRMNGAADYLCTVAGRCCESGDIIQKDVMLQKPQRGDILAVFGTGAYNYSMASNYNALPKPPVIMLGETEYVAVKRQTFEDMISCQL